MMHEANPVVTIDGPSGTGKGTICQMLAKELGWRTLDSGALYRALAFAAKQHHVAFDNECGLKILAAHLDVQFKVTSNDSCMQIILEGEDITDAIRSEEYGNSASLVAVLPGVRQALLDRQRAFCEAPGLVADGRDMGTVVFPQAFFKVFLKASDEERARRRHAQLKEKGMNVSLASVLSEIKARDARDRGRSVAPLCSARDAMVLDTTRMSIVEVCDLLLDEVRARLVRQAG